MTLSSSDRLDTGTPAIILGFTLSGLGIARSLAKHGVECWILYNDPNDPSLKTRHGRKCQIRDLSGEAIAAGVRAVWNRTHKHAVLFPTSDSTVEMYAENYDRLKEYLCNEITPRDVLVESMSKDKLDALFIKAEIDSPKTVCIDSINNKEELLQLRYPCILKPHAKSEEYSGRFPKAFFVDSPAEALDRFREIGSVAGRAVVQEYLAGPDTEIFFCLAVTDRAGKIVHRFAGRKLASWPRRTGSTAACIPAPAEEARLTEMTQRFFHAAGFFGIGSLEFKRDPETGRFLAIEPTVARVDTQSELAVLNGVNLPLAYYCLQTGQPPPLVKPTAPVGWADPVAMARLRRASGKSKPFEVPPIKLVDALWRADDPGPWLSLHGQRVLNAPRALLRRIGQKAGAVPRP